MERDNQDLYYHGGLGAENRRNYGPGNRDREDFGRAYDHRNENHTSGNGHYQRRDYDTGNRNYERMRGERHYPGSMEQGVSSFGGSSYAADRNQQPWERDEQQQQQGYGTGRMSGYSGSAFGGANYSSHGGYGDSSRYGAMSGGGGNMDEDVSSSGYGSSNRGRSNPGQDAGYDKPSRHNTGQNGYSGSYDRGGYRNYDPNNRWR